MLSFLRCLLMMGLVFQAAGTLKAFGDSPVTDFVGQTITGDVVRLSDIKAPYVIVAFLGTECPLVTQYLPLLNQLSREQSDTVVLGIMSNWHDSIDEITSFAAAQQVEFPIVQDAEASLADRFGATRTPQVFLLDRERIIRYQGCIDDRFGVDYRRTTPRHRYLTSALDELRSGRNVTCPHSPVVGCLIGRSPQPKADANVTWYGNVFALFQRRCHECHRTGQVAPFSLLTYEEAAGWAPMIDEVVKQKRMPPWYASPSDEEFANDCRLSNEECRLIATWIEQGMPEGNPSNAPPPRDYPEGWLHEPDLVIPMADKPASIPANGPAFISRFLVKPNWAEGRWVKGVECRPGNRAVVHHMGVFVVAPAVDPLQHWARRYLDFLFGYSPGILDLNLPEGMAQYIPPGAQLLFELHYVPNGMATTDLSQLGLRFEESKNVRHLVRSQLVVNEIPIAIPPYTPDYVVEGQTTLTSPAQLLAMTGHAHVRCRTFDFEAKYPSGKWESLLSIPDYDMYWQQLYELKRPKELPAGTQVRCVAHYDNSAGYRRNPDPSATVYDGDEDVFGNEMMNGFLFLGERRPKVLPTVADARDLLPVADEDHIEPVERQVKRSWLWLVPLGLAVFGVLSWARLNRRV